MQEITASQTVKAHGLKSTRYVAEKIGKHEITLINWFKNNRKLFDIVILGCVQSDLQLQQHDCQPAEHSES